MITETIILNSIIEISNMTLQQLKKVMPKCKERSVSIACMIVSLIIPISVILCTKPHTLNTLVSGWLNKNVGGEHTGLWCDTSPLRSLFHCLIPDWHPDNDTNQFLEKFSPILKKNLFSSSKIYWVGAFLINLSKFQ